MATGFTFPLTPTVDQEVTLADGGKVKWNGYAWVEVSAGGGTAASNTTVSDTAPAAPNYGDRWLRPASMTEVVWAPNAGTPGAWVNPAEAGGWDTAAYVKKAGDTMTGQLSVAPVSGTARLAIDKPTTADYAYIDGKKAGVARWGIALGNSTPESGSNAGNDFTIDRYSDTGAFLGSGMAIMRSTGSVNFDSSPLLIKNTNSAGNTYLHMDKKASTDACDIYTSFANAARWLMRLGDGRPGDPFSLQPYNDAGASVGIVLSIDRPTGISTFYKEISTQPSSTITGQASSLACLNTLTMANGAIVTLAQSGVVIITETSINGITGFFVTGGGNVQLVGGVASFYSNVKDTAAKINLYYNGAGAYDLQNFQGAARTINIMTFKLRVGA